MCTYCANFAHNLSADVTAATTTSTTGTTTTTKEFWSVDQVADQLTNGYWESTGRTARKFDLGTDNTLVVDLTALTDKGLAAARQALQAWTDASGIKFVEYTAGSGKTVDIAFSDDYSGAYTSSSVVGGEIVKSYVNINDSFASGAYFLQTYIHEIGHALGLGHAGNYNGTGTFSTQALFANDTWQYSIMSYFYQTQSPYTNASFLYVSTPQIADVQAIQNLYGVSTTVHAGATTYGDGGTVSIINNRAQTIVDAGGTDTIDLSTRSQNQYLDLNDGTFSNIGGYKGNLAIAQGTMIENATLGAGNDTIVGNELANVLKSGAGNDVVSGGAGNDTIDGGAGADKIDGGAGNDLLIGGAGNDTISGGAGTDAVQYSGNASAYAFLMSAEGLYVDGADGLDLIVDAESVVFADVSCLVSEISAVFGSVSGVVWMTGADLLDAIAALSGSKVVAVTPPTSSTVTTTPTETAPATETETDTGSTATQTSGHMEVGQVSVTGGSGWIHVSFGQTIENAIVVLGPISISGSDPVTAEVINVTSTGFDIRLSEYNYLDGKHVVESLSWMAGTEGTHYLDDGTRITFGETALKGETMTKVTVDGYDNDALVFGSLVGTGSATMVARIDSDSSATSFSVGMQAQESLRGTVASETRSFDWVVIEPAETSEITSGTVKVTDKFTGTTADSDLALFAEMSTIKGADTASVRYTTDASGKVSLQIDEETSKDAETAHTTETVNWINLSKGSYDLYGSSVDVTTAGLTGDSTESTGEAALEVGTISLDRASISSDGWIHVTFSEAIADAVVVVGPLSTAGTDPVVAELNNITSTGFDIRLSEYNYSDGAHVLETISWMAGSAGTHELADGTRLTFGSQAVTGESAVAIDYDSDTTPILLGAVSTTEDVTLTYRFSDVGADGAQMQLQTQESLSGTQSSVSAVLQWVAIEAGNGDTVSDGTLLVSDKTSAISADSTEALFASMQSLNGSDTASVRYTLSGDTFLLYLDEEQSLNAETSHVNETVSWIGIDEGRYDFVSTTSSVAQIDLLDTTAALANSLILTDADLAYL